MIARSNEAEPLIAFVYGNTPPDLDAIAVTIWLLVLTLVVVVKYGGALVA